MQKSLLRIYTRWWIVAKKCLGLNGIVVVACQQILIHLGNDNVVLTKHHKLICQWVASTLINSNGLGMVVAAKGNKGGGWNTMVTHS